MLIITRKDNKNVVMLSEKSYNNLIENAYIVGDKANYDWLMESKKHKIDESNVYILACRYHYSDM